MYKYNHGLVIFAVCTAFSVLSILVYASIVRGKKEITLSDYSRLFELKLDINNSKYEKVINGKKYIVINKDNNEEISKEALSYRKNVILKDETIPKIFNSKNKQNFLKKFNDAMADKVIVYSEKDEIIEEINKEDVLKEYYLDKYEEKKKL